MIALNEHYDILTIRVPTGMKRKYEVAAEGLEMSMDSMIMAAVAEYVDRRWKSGYPPAGLDVF